MPTTEAIKRTLRCVDTSATFKLGVICTLSLMLLLPVSMVKSLINERELRKGKVIHEINRKWGQAQTISGPVISIPYLVGIPEQKGKRTTETHFMHLLPDTVNIDSQITPHVRYRGIYSAVLYDTMLSIDGSFPGVPVDKLKVPPENVLWSGAIISFGITDMRGIKENIEVTFDGQHLQMEPGIVTDDVIHSGASASIKLNESRTSIPFHLDLNLNGSRQINFSPVGKVTEVNARSEWKDPSFGGAFLPVERSLTDQGFEAKWRVLHLNRNYPQYWTGNRYDISGSAFGVRLYDAVNVYQKSTRTAKYALMFIVFAFLAFFISEVVCRLRVHPVQYLLIGLVVILFYTLLLSISEYFKFNVAYLSSAGAVIGLISGYAKAILKSHRLALTAGGILTILYAYLYVLLQLEDYALLMGSVGLFIALSLVMYVTRNIDWYTVQRGPLKTRGEPAKQATT